MCICIFIVNEDDNVICIFIVDEDDNVYLYFYLNVELYLCIGV